MESVLGVDFASRYSAAVRMSAGGEVKHQFDSWKVSENTWLDGLTFTLASYVIVEDLPPSVPWSSIVKGVACQQGRLIERMETNGVSSKLVFLSPATWQRYFPGIWRKGPDVSAEYAASLGYVPPDLSNGLKGKARTTAKKVQTDYVMAFLIARWAVETLEKEGHLNVPGTARYEGWIPGE